MPDRPPLDCAVLSHKGMVRTHNEDAVFVDATAGIAVLADGMGGYNAGEVASGIAVNVVSSGMLPELRSDRELSKVDIASGLTHAALLLQQKIAVANKGIYEAAQARPECAGMGTTLVSLVFCGNRVSIGHIGDSRCYRLRGDKFEQLTHDHSLLQEQIDGGQLTPEQARFSLNKNLVTRALGIEAIVPADIVEYRAEAEDIYLLNSDGLTDMVEPAMVQSIIEKKRDSLDRRGEGAGRRRQPEWRARQHLRRAGPGAEGLPAERRLGAAVAREKACKLDSGPGRWASSCISRLTARCSRSSSTASASRLGRRPDNDVCLPYPAVSGEHAAVVTILDDSFLEDLGSTNGTLVNGAAVAKHFLRDRDEIDVGRHVLVYLEDDAATLEAPPPASPDGARQREAPDATSRLPGALRAKRRFDFAAAPARPAAVAVSLAAGPGCGRRRCFG